MDSDIRKRLAAATQKLESIRKPLSESQSQRVATTKTAKNAAKTRRRRSPLIWVGGIVLVVVALVVIAFLVFGREKKPAPAPFTIPASIKSSVQFPIYFPDQTKLPPGYTFDQNSLSASGQAVLYSVSYGNGKKIAFTLQPKPDETGLNTFYVNRIPLRTEVTVPLGTVAVSTLNDQTFLSLPTKSNAWLLATAPQDVDRDRLLDIIKALRQ